MSKSGIYLFCVCVCVFYIQMEQHIVKIVLDGSKKII